MPTVARALRLVTILGGIVLGAFILWASLVNAAERQEQHSGAGQSWSEAPSERGAVVAVIWGGHAGGQVRADASGLLAKMPGNVGRVSYGGPAC
jgi:hypothetical protein